MSAKRTDTNTNRNRGQELIEYGANLKRDAIILGIIIGLFLALFNLQTILNQPENLLVLLILWVIIVFVLYRISCFFEMILGSLGERLINAERTVQLLTDIKAKIPNSYSLNRNNSTESGSHVPSQDNMSDIVDDFKDLDDVLDEQAPFKPINKSPFKPLSNQ
ncbi:hypothetical protein SAMN02910456_00636 [Ruminococcaceae bacterium YRB3002]|nr:hypothetical protein SAMN02910456_00636 [Ruminococcaceae bacterium YRB3002]